MQGRRLGGGGSGGTEPSAAGGAFGNTPVRAKGSTASRLQAAREQFVQEFGGSLGGRSGDGTALYERQLTGASASRSRERGLARGRPPADVGSAEWEERRARRTMTVHQGALPDREAGSGSTSGGAHTSWGEASGGGSTAKGQQSVREEAVPAEDGWEDAEGSVAPRMRRRATVTASLSRGPSHAEGDWAATPQGSSRAGASPKGGGDQGLPSRGSHLGGRTQQDEPSPPSGARKSLASARSMSPLSRLALQQQHGAEASDEYADALQGGTDSSLPEQRKPFIRPFRVPL